MWSSFKNKKHDFHAEAERITEVLEGNDDMKVLVFRPSKVNFYQETMEISLRSDKKSGIMEASENDWSNTMDSILPYNNYQKLKDFNSKIVVTTDETEEAVVVLETENNVNEKIPEIAELIVKKKTKPAKAVNKRQKVAET